MADGAIDIHRELIEACGRGERLAYYQLYKLYSKAMYNAALRIVKNTQEAEDVLQESFLNAFNNINSYKGDSTFGAWLKRIVVNRSINHLRKKQLDLISMDESVNEIAEDADDMMIYNVESVKGAIEELPDGYRVVLSLYLLEGYDHQEIADILNISVSTSKSQYNRAKGKLRSMLNKQEVYYG